MTSSKPPTRQAEAELRRLKEELAEEREEGALAAQGVHHSGYCEAPEIPCCRCRWELERARADTYLSFIWEAIEVFPEAHQDDDLITRRMVGLPVGNEERARLKVLLVLRAAARGERYD